MRIFTFCLLLFFSSSIMAQTWSQLNNYPGGNRYGAVSFVIEDSVYVGLGSDGTIEYDDFYKYDAVNDSWVQIADFPGGARKFAVAFAIGDKGYVGLGDASGVSYEQDFYEYDPATNTWTSIADFGGTGRKEAVSFVIGDSAYVGSGIDNSDEKKDFWRYDPVSDTWAQKADLDADKRRGATAFAINGKGYITGGFHSDGFQNQLSDIREYDPVADEWSEKVFADGLNLSINYANAFVLLGEAYICYGSKKNVIIYDPVENDYTKSTDPLSLTTTDYYPIAFALNDTGFFGLGDVGTATNKMWKCIPNHAPTDITITVDTILEDKPAGSVVGTLDGVDDDSGDTHTFTFVSGSNDNSEFEITGADLKIKNSVNFETKDTLNIHIKAEDNGGKSVEKEMKIFVKDVNEAITGMFLLNDAVDENAPVGTVVGEIEVSDEDLNETHTFTFITVGGSGVDNDKFSIDGYNLITAEVLDYETITSCEIKIEAEDKGGNTYQKGFYISVNDVNENLAPTDISLSSNEIAEDQTAGSTVGNLSATDANSGDSHTFTLVSGNGTNDADNSSFAISGVKLNTAVALDYETKSSYNINIKVEDNAGASFTKAFVINILDVTTGIDDIQFVSRIYPSPSSGMVNIERRSNYPVDITVFDVTGRVVFQAEIKDKVSSIDLSNLHNGLYFLKYKDAGVINTHKLIIKKN